jgi:hypothetical protein
MVKNKKAAPEAKGCGKINDIRLFSLPYAGITQFRF